jgi:hypothetical protein
MNSRAIVFAVVVAVCATAASAGTVWDAVADFSGASNPNGAWSYGYGVGPIWGGAFDLGWVDATGGGWTRSQGGAPDYSPYMAANLTDTAGTYPAHSLNLSSGTGGDDYHCLVRWTAPADGWYQVDSVYAMMSYADGSYWTGEMDVTTAVNGVAVFADKVSGFDYSGYYGVPEWPTYEPGPKSATGTYYLLAGNTVDFAAGIGWINAGSDFANVGGCKVTAVPEPSTLVALLSAAGALIACVGFRWRK